MPPGRSWADLASGAPAARAYPALNCAVVAFAVVSSQFAVGGEKPRNELDKIPERGLVPPFGVKTRPGRRCHGVTLQMTAGHVWLVN